MMYQRFGATKKPYQFFICHHKARAGCFARLLKMHLLKASKVTRQVFLDCDNLDNLDTLFEVVGNHVETLIIVASKDVFLRPWCAGEMTYARLKGVPITVIEMPGWEAPEKDVIES